MTTMRMRHLLTSCTLLLSVLAIPLTAHSQENWYQFDVVIFKQRGDSTHQERVERVLPHSKNPKAVNLRTHNQQDLNTTPYVRLPDNLSLINKEAEQLRKASGYSILWQRSWRMPLVKDGAEVAIAVEGGQSLEGSHQVEGALVFSLRRYLHTHADLWINTLKTGQPQASELTDESQESSFADSLPYSRNRQFKMGQRLQLNQLIYMDNPDVGILIKATPWKGAAS